MEKIDFVVTYLDNTDKEWQKEKSFYSGQETDDLLNGNERYRNMDNFQYWFRAIEKYAPWVNKIHLVTYGHLPEWLNTDHPKLNIVKHEDYIPKEYLPTFNSNVLELNMDRISGLSEHFVNFNDDFFLNAPVKPEDFFSEGEPVLQAMHTPILPSEAFNVVLFNNILALNELDQPKKKLFQAKNFSPKQGIFTIAGNLIMLPILLYMKKFVGYRPDHLAQPMKKSVLSELRELTPVKFEQACSSKFRTMETINIWFVLDYLRATGQFVPHNSFKFGALTAIGEEVDYADLLGSSYKILCLNDSSVKDFEKEKERLNEAFSNKFPQKSEFEK